MKSILWLIAVVASCTSAQTGSPAMPEAAKQKIDFDRDVQPILSAKCFDCHVHRSSSSACVSIRGFRR